MPLMDNFIAYIFKVSLKNLQLFQIEFQFGPRKGKSRCVIHKLLLQRPPLVEPIRYELRKHSCADPNQN